LPGLCCSKKRKRTQRKPWPKPSAIFSIPQKASDKTLGYIHWNWKSSGQRSEVSPFSNFLKASTENQIKVYKLRAGDFSRDWSRSHKKTVFGKQQKQLWADFRPVISRGPPSFRGWLDLQDQKRSISE